MAAATIEAPRKFQGTTLADRVCAFVRAAYQGRHATKRLAQDADVSPRTAENWLCGQNGLRAESLVRLMAVHPTLQQQINDDVALLRRVRQSQQTARTRLDETNSRDRAAMDRTRDAVAVRADGQPVRAPVDTGVSHEGV